jgi:hypothetical protein
MTHLGIALAIAGVIMCVAAMAGAAWSYWRLAGSSAGAALSAACFVLAAGGVAVAAAGAVVSHG